MYICLHLLRLAIGIYWKFIDSYCYLYHTKNTSMIITGSSYIAIHISSDMHKDCFHLLGSIAGNIVNSYTREIRIVDSYNFITHRIFCSTASHVSYCWRNQVPRSV